ncbi:MAG: ATP-binding protein [Alcanivorax sp.]
MDKILLRNFLIFVTILLTCSSGLIVTLVGTNKDLDQTDLLIELTQARITEAEQLSTEIESMISSQRGYLISGQQHFLDSYEAHKSRVSQHLANLSELYANRPAQKSRIDEIRNFYTDFAVKLEERAQLTSEIEPRPDIMNDIEIIDDIKDNITSTNKVVLREAYAKLEQHIKKLDAKRSSYFSTLIISIAFGTLLILLLNWFLLKAQRKRSSIQETLEDAEQRFKLVIDGTQDGIYDWDMQSGAVFYSQRFHTMLGYDEEAKTAEIDVFYDLIHEDDIAQVKQHIQDYISGNKSEFIHDFRMKHAKGQWIWMQVRSKALFDRRGNAYRFVAALTDITHVVRERALLERQKEQAEDANRAKTDFLAHMSHEIRTPLTAINGIAEILTKNQSNLDDRQKKLVSTLMSSTSTLKDLINDLLDFSKIESGELELEEQSFEVSEIFEQTISMMSLKAAEKGISFLFDYKKVDDLTIVGDKQRMRQVLVNLIGNAIKFTEEGSVKISAYIEPRREVECLCIDVADTGIGIEAEKFDMIFERFKQADPSVTRKYGGTGLGLPISRNLARLMGGDIVISSAIGEGTTFTVFIPLSEASSHGDNKEKKRINKKINKKFLNVGNDNKPILIVEDYEGNVVVISYVLEEAGIPYDVASNGIEAIEKWADRQYAAILMDVQMPKMDGFTATKRIRDAERDEELVRTPIIGMTAHALIGDKDKCIDAGMDEYLPKPIVDSDLKRVLLKYLHVDEEAA